MVLYRYNKMFNLIEEDFRNFVDVTGNASYPSSPESSSTSDYSGDFRPSWDNIDFLHNVKYDQIEQEKNPEYFTLVSPVHCTTTEDSRSPSPSISLSPELPYEEENTLADMSSNVPWELFLPNFSLDDFTEDFINDIAKVDINSTIFDEALDSAFVNERSPTKAVAESAEESKDATESKVVVKQSYLEFDHNYSAQPVDEDLRKINYWNVSPSSPTSSTSSEEVDVVTVTEESSPVVPKVVIAPKPTRKRGRKSVNKKTAQSAPIHVTAKSLKTALKNTRITSVRKTHKRRKNNVDKHIISTFTSPSISGHSSLCNSDNEDAGKRANHNSSERKRREVLRNNLQFLRLTVPTTKDNPKAAKVTILNGAAKYVTELRHAEQELMKKKKHEEQKRRQKEAELKSLLAQVKRQFC